MRSYTLVLSIASTLALPACGDKPDETTSLSSGTADTTTGVPGLTSTTDATSGSTATSDDTAATSTTGGSTGATSPTTGATTDATTTDATTTDATTGPADCVGLGAMQCEADAACLAVEGGKLNLEKMCVGKTMFLGCIDAGVCGGAETIGCAPDADPAEPHLFPSTCLPPDWQPCEAPAISEPCK